MVKRFQYGVLAGPEGALLDLLLYEFKIRKNRFKALSLEFCLAAALRGAVEYWAFLRVATSNWDVS